MNEKIMKKKQEISKFEQRIKNDSERIQKLTKEISVLEFSEIHKLMKIQNISFEELQSTLENIKTDKGVQSNTFEEKGEK